MGRERDRERERVGGGRERGPKEKRTHFPLLTHFSFVRVKINTQFSHSLCFFLLFILSILAHFSRSALVCVCVCFSYLCVCVSVWHSAICCYSANVDCAAAALLALVANFLLQYSKYQLISYQIRKFII